jgi:hypothetical protein
VAAGPARLGEQALLEGPVVGEAREGVGRRLGGEPGPVLGVGDRNGDELGEVAEQGSRPRGTGRVLAHHRQDAPLGAVDADRRRQRAVGGGAGELGGDPRPGDDGGAAALGAQHARRLAVHDPRRLAGDEVEQLLQVAALRDGGGDPAQRGLLELAGREAGVQLAHLPRERVHRLVHQVAALVELRVGPVDALEQAGPRPDVRRRRAGHEPRLAQLAHEQPVHHASDNVVMVMVWLWRSQVPPPAGAISPYE